MEPVLTAVQWHEEAPPTGHTHHFLKEPPHADMAEGRAYEAPQLHRHGQQAAVEESVDLPTSFEATPTVTPSPFHPPPRPQLSSTHKLEFVSDKTKLQKL